MGERERAGEWARDYHFSFSGLTDPNNRVSTGGESEGREDSEDKNQSLNPPNQQLSGDSTDTLDPSSRLPSFVLMKAMPSLSRQKVLTTNPDDFSPPLPPPSSSLHQFPPFPMWESSGCQSEKADVGTQVSPKSTQSSYSVSVFWFIWLHSMWTAHGCMLQILSYFVHVTGYSWMFFYAWVFPFCSSYQTGLALTASSYHRMYKQNKPTINACTVDTNLGETHTHYQSKLVNVTTD